VNRIYYDNPRRSVSIASRTRLSERKVYVSTPRVKKSIANCSNANVKKEVAEVQGGQSPENLLLCSITKNSNPVNQKYPLNAKKGDEVYPRRPLPLPYYAAISTAASPLIVVPLRNSNDLISGLYFSLFYMKSGIQIYRKCANPNCEQYFIVQYMRSVLHYVSTIFARKGFSENATECVCGENCAALYAKNSNVLIRTRFVPIKTSVPIRTNALSAPAGIGNEKYIIRAQTAVKD